MCSTIYQMRLSLSPTTTTLANKKTPTNRSNQPPVLIPTDRAYPTSTSRAISIDHKIPTLQQPGMLPGFSYRRPSESRRAKLPRINDDQDNECVDDSDDGQGQGLSFSVAGPWLDVGQGAQGPEELLEGWRRAGGCKCDSGGNIGMPTVHDDDSEHTLQVIS